MAKPIRKSDKDGLYQRENSACWYVSYTDGSGKRTRRSTGTTDRKEAEALLAKWRLEAHRERQWDEQPTRTFRRTDAGLFDARRRTANAAPNGDRYALKQLYPFFTGRELATLTAQDIRAYIVSRREAGIFPATINRELSVLSSALNYARREWGWEIPNPTSGRKLPVPEGRVRWLSSAQATVLIEAAESEPKAPHLADFIRLALHTGMRRGELLGLEWQRVDLHGGLIHLEGRHTKAGKRRSIPINREARIALINRARFRAEYCPASLWVFLWGRRLAHSVGQAELWHRLPACRDRGFPCPRSEALVRCLVGDSRCAASRGAGSLGSQLGGDDGALRAPCTRECSRRCDAVGRI